MHGERDVQADVARGLGDRARLGREIGQALDARIVRHGGAHAAARNAPERHRRGEPGIDRGDKGEVRQPRFERHVEAADLAQTRHPRMVVRAGEGGQYEPALAGTVLNGSDAAVRDRNDAIPGRWSDGIRNEPGCRDAMGRHPLSPAITEPLTY